MVFASRLILSLPFFASISSFCCDELLPVDALNLQKFRNKEPLLMVILLEKSKILKTLILATVQWVMKKNYNWLNYWWLSFQNLQFRSSPSPAIYNVQVEQRQRVIYLQLYLDNSFAAIQYSDEIWKLLTLPANSNYRFSKIWLS